MSNDISLDLRKRIVQAYRSGRSGTYEETARMFGVGYATVSRILRRFRETGDVKPRPKGGNNPRRVDLDWLRKHAESEPDARIIDRIEAWRVHSGKSVSIGAMWHALAAIGWTHKKKHRSQESATATTSASAEKPSSRRSRTSIRSD